MGFGDSVAILAQEPPWSLALGAAPVARWLRTFSSERPRRRRMRRLRRCNVRPRLHGQPVAPWRRLRSLQPPGLAQRLRRPSAASTATPRRSGSGSWPWPRPSMSRCGPVLKAGSRACQGQRGRRATSRRIGARAPAAAPCRRRWRSLSAHSAAAGGEAAGRRRSSMAPGFLAAPPATTTPAPGVLVGALRWQLPFGCAGWAGLAFLHR